MTCSTTCHDPHGTVYNFMIQDFYYPQDGVANTKEQRAEMNQRFAALDQQRREFLAYLQEIGQGRDGGAHILRRIAHLAENG